MKVLLVLVGLALTLTAAAPAQAGTAQHYAELNGYCHEDASVRASSSFERHSRCGPTSSG
jgi:hypothetical protein